MERFTIELSIGTHYRLCKRINHFLRLLFLFSSFSISFCNILHTYIKVVVVYCQYSIVRLRCLTWIFGFFFFFLLDCRLKLSCRNHHLHSRFALFYRQQINDFISVIQRMFHHIQSIPAHRYSDTTSVKTTKLLVFGNNSMQI